MKPLERRWRIKSSGILQRDDCSKCLPVTGDGGSMPLRNVGNLTSSHGCKIQKTWQFKLNPGLSYYEAVRRYIPYRPSPMKRSYQTYIVPHNVCVCVCARARVGGGGRGREGRERRNRREGIC
jgi:hypothetical protein